MKKGTPFHWFKERVGNHVYRLDEDGYFKVFIRDIYHARWLSVTSEETGDQYFDVLP